MRILQRLCVLCLLALCAIAEAAAGEAIGVMVDRKVDDARRTFVCIVTLEGEPGQCFIENMSPGDFVWETIRYHASGKFLLAEKQNPPSLWTFSLNGESAKVVESANGITERAMADREPAIYYIMMNEKYETSVYRYEAPEGPAEPAIKVCPGNSPEGLAFDAANQRVVYFAMSDDMMSKNLVAYDPACENELVKFALPDDVMANTITAVLSPDGNSATYLGFSMGAETKSGLYLTNIASKETVDLLKDHGDDLEPGQPESFSFSPGGKNIAMIYLTKDAKQHLYIVSADGKSLVKAESDEIETFRSEQPVWHPSGEFVTTTAMIKGTGNSDVFALSTTGELTNLTAEDPNFKFAQSISHDGNYMAYISSYAQNLNLYDLEAKKLLGSYPEPGSYAFPKWIASGE